MNFRKTISETELRRLYFDERMTQEEIAVKLGCGATTIKRRMIDLGIEIRARGPEPGGNIDFRYNNPEWTPALAYIVGTITADGNLSPDGRHLTIKSKDKDWIEDIKELLGLDNRIGIERKLWRKYYRLTLRRANPK